MIFKKIFCPVVFASPYKSKIKVLQSIGRSLRLGDNKDEAVVYDIIDDLRHGDYINHAVKHFIERTKLYDAEKFDFKLYPTEFKNG